MKYLNETETLNEAIIQLQTIQAWEFEILKAQFYITYESIKPINLIKNALREVTTMPDLKNNLINNAVGLAAGFLSNKFIIGTSHNPVKKVFGSFIQYAIANVVSKRSHAYKSANNNLERMVNGRKL